MSDPRLIALPGAHNIRDMGGWPAAWGETGYRRALRADSLHRLSLESLESLRALGLTRVIDLRRAEELEEAPNPFAANDGPGAGVDYRHLSLLEDLDPTRLPPAADAAEPLLRLYLMALEQRGLIFAEILRLIAGAEGAVLFHCTAGKDRTGMVAAFLLLLAGAPRAAVIEDYAATAPRLPTLLADLRVEAAARGRDLDEISPYLGAEAPVMDAFLTHLDAEHGGIEPYLRRHGLTEAELDQLRRRLRPAPVSA